MSRRAGSAARPTAVFTITAVRSRGRRAEQQTVRAGARWTWAHPAPIFQSITVLNCQAAAHAWQGDDHVHSDRSDAQPGNAEIHSGPAGDRRGAARVPLARRGDELAS